MSTSSAATFNGNAMFGLVVEMVTGDDQRETQQNSYFGLNGIESINGGSRGRRTSVSGVLYGSNLSDLAQAEAFFRSYRDGNAYVLVEVDGTTWPQAMLSAFNPQGRRQTDVMTGVCFRNYSAVFEHLI